MHGPVNIKFKNTKSAFYIVAHKTIWVAWYQIMRDVHVKLNPELPWQTQRSPTRKLFSTVNWKKLVKCHIWSIATYGDETWTVRKVDQKHL